MSPPTPASAFSQFQEAFKGDLVAPGDPDYEDAIKRWSAPAQRRAAIVAFVKGTDDIALALKYARENGLQIAVKGGGHNPSGASSVEGGLVIDLSKYLNNVRVDAEKKLAYVEGGALWATVDKTTIQYGLATTGGTVNHTGVGGLSLAGGYGYLAAQHGLVIDNIAQATVVIADGTTLTASDEENADLFWAIRGGGSNFGVCTELVLRLHTQRPTVFAGVVMFPQTALQQLTAIMTEKFEQGIKEKECFFELLTLGQDGKPCVALLLFFNGSEIEGRAHYKSLFDLNPMLDTCKEIPYEVLNSLINYKFPHGGNYYFKPVSQAAPDFATAQRTLDRLVELSTQHGIEIGFTYEFWGYTKICSVPNGTMAFVRSPDLVCVMFVQYKDDNEEGLGVARNIAKELVDIVYGTSDESAPGRQNFGYANYTTETTTTTHSQALFRDNYKKLQVVKKKYDPNMVFSKWYPIVPAA